MRRSPWLALLVLTAINAANYIDRYVAVAVNPLIKQEFQLNEEQIGDLATAFMFVYAFAAPVLGILGDRISRKAIISGSVAVWSVATAMGALCPTFHWLMLARATVGIGEAGYGSACPSWIADLFPPRRRSLALGIFYSALPLGAAIGFWLGGAIGEHLGWRYALTAIGLPGLLLALGVIFLDEPVRGVNDKADGAQDADAGAHAGHGAGGPPPTLADYMALLSNRAALAVCVAMASMTFVVGGMAVHAPEFFTKVRLLSLSEANLRFGISTALAGIVGTSLGGFLGDWANRRWRGGYLLVSGLGMLVAAPICVAALRQSDPDAAFRILCMGQVFLFLNQGPLNAAMANCTPAHARTAAYSMSIFITHLLGDIPSPKLIGRLADHTSMSFAMTSTAWLAAVSGAVMLMGMRYMRPPASAPASPAPEPS